MEYRDFGATGLKVSALGYGCWEMGGNYGDFAVDQMTRAVNAAIDAGVNIFDTALAYGDSEALLGRALGPRRKDVIVVTKCGIADRPGLLGFRDGRRETILASIDRSLARLGTDYVDVLLVHWPNRKVPFEETMAALDEIERAGKARFIGLSNFKVEEIEYCRRLRRIEVIQCGLHLFDRRMEPEVLPYCRENNLGVMIYGSLGFGLLTGAFSRDTRFPDNDWRQRGGSPGLVMGLFSAEKFPRNVGAVEDLKPVAARLGKTLPQVALAWVLGHPAVSVALAGMRTSDEVRDNLGAVGWTVDPATCAEIDAIFARHGVDSRPPFWIE
jgi:aryl-alcohol dehydrogenase-like predicted oxidoreductase